MNGIAVSEQQVVPLEDVAWGVRGVRILFVNVFAVSHPESSWTLIDAGLPFSATHIRKWAERNFHRPPNALILTHGHFDHVGAAKELAEGWDIPIYAHPLEFPYLTGKQEYPKPNVQAGGGMMTLLSPLYPRGPIDVGDRLIALTEGDDGTAARGLSSLRELPGWQLLHTPGHTPGHVSFFRSSDRTLLVGDAFCTTAPESFFEAAVVERPELHGPPSYFTSDWASARASVEQLASLRPTTLAPGHGKPLAGDEIPARLTKLAEEFDRAAVPGKRPREATETQRRATG
jgi:glyoxylase-like metal-dependent hydrolase (beta-lactamase superfamily II)